MATDLTTYTTKAGLAQEGDVLFLKNGAVFSVDGTEYTATAVKAILDGIGTTDIADDAVTKAKIAADVAGTGLAQDTDGSLKVSTGTAASLAKADASVAGAAAGYKAARSNGTVDVTGTLEITTGLATVVSVTAGLGEDAALTGDTVTWTIPTQTGGDAGKFTVKVWKRTGAADCTPLAADAAKKVTWIAVGT